MQRGHRRRTIQIKKQNGKNKKRKNTRAIDEAATVYEIENCYESMQILGIVSSAHYVIPVAKIDCGPAEDRRTPSLIIEIC
jgi:hypothetical protein